MAKRDPEFVAYDRRARKDEEATDIEAFTEAYEWATGESLEVETHDDSPDAICVMPDGTIVGVEHTRIRRSPEDARWDAILNYRDEMSVEATYDEIVRLVYKKAALRQRFATEYNILLIAIYETEFRTAIAAAKLIPIEDLGDTGFDEVWLADLRGIRDGVHRSARLFGLYPDELRSLTDHRPLDQKPYG